MSALIYLYHFYSNCYQQLHDNALTSLPNEIGALESLIRVNFSHNKLTELPKSFFKLCELKVLNLSHNQFNEITTDLIDMIMLESLVS